MPRLTALLAVVLALLGLALAAAPAAQAGPARSLHIGRISPAASADTYLRKLDLAKAAGFRAVRADLAWADLEPDGPGAMSSSALGLFDAVADGARKRGMRLLPVFLSTPCWASSLPGKDCGSPAGREAARKWPPANPQDYANAAAFLAGRLRDVLHGFEVWNEPDQANENYFAGPDKVQRYAALLRTAYPALKRAAPQAPVLGGALVGANGLFLEALYKAGIKGSYDVLSMHLYDLVLTSVRNIRAVQARNGDTKPVWLGETGYTSCAPRATKVGGQVCTTRAGQKQFTVDLLRMTRRSRALAGITIYELQDGDGYEFGLVDRAGRRKPVFGALAREAKRPGRLRGVRLGARRTASGIRITVSGPTADLYDLVVRQGSRRVFTAQLRLGRTGRYSGVLPAALRNAPGLRINVRHVWSGRGASRRV